MNQLPGIARALRHRNFRLFFCGQLVSLVGTWMQSVAQAWLVYRLTHSALLLGIAGFCNQIPVFVLAPAGGVVADRFRRHSTLLVTQSSMMMLAFGLAFLTLTGRVRVAHVLFLATLLGCANAFDIPARQAFISQMVARQDLANAIALNSSMVTGARVVGPALAGLTVAAIGEGWCFFANALTFVALLAALLNMRDLPAKAAVPAGSVLAHVAEGFSFVARSPAILALLALLGASSLLGTPYSTLMPAIADSILRAGARGLGVLMAAAGGGALLGALALASRGPIRGLGRWVWLAAAVFGIALMAFSLSRVFWLSAALLVPVGGGFMVQMAGTNTLVQSMSPDAMRGRVMAAYSMMFMGMAPAGALLAGVLATRIGPLGTVAAGGAGCLVAALVFASNRKRLRQATRRMLAAVEAGTPAEPGTEL